MPRFTYALGLVAHAARFVVGRGKPFAGEIEISFRWSTGKRTHQYTVTDPAVLLVPALPELLMGSLSKYIYAKDELALLIALYEKPLKGDALWKKLGWSRTKGMDVISRLQDRTIVFNGEDGYDISDGPWRGLIDPSEIVPQSVERPDPVRTSTKSLAT